MPSTTAALVGLWDCCLEYNRTYMALRNFSEATRRGYASDLRLFIRYLSEERAVNAVQAVEKIHVHEYFAELDRRGRAGVTRARNLAAVKSFFGYLEDAGVIERSPAKAIPRPKQEVREPRVLTEDQYVRLRAACADHPRERALIELFLQTGLRLSEVASLTLGDLQLPPPRSVGAVSVHGKGRKRRTVSLNWKALTRCERICATGRLRQPPPSSSPEPVDGLRRARSKGLSRGI